MDRLFAPWRSQYIAGFKQGVDRPGCVFCAALESHDDEAMLLIYRSSEAFVLMNRYPYNSGHLLIIPNRHTNAFESLSAAESSDMQQLLVKSNAALTELVRPHAFNIGMNLGRTAGAGIDDHLHWHIVPRWDGDTNFMTVTADVKLISEDMTKQWRALREVFEKV